MEFRFVQDLEIVLELTGFSMEELAAELGVSRATVSNWLSGKKAATEKNIASFYEYAFRKGVQLNLIKERLYREELAEPSEVLLFYGTNVKREGEIHIDDIRYRNDFGEGLYCGVSPKQSDMLVPKCLNPCLYMLRFRQEGLWGKEFGVSREWILTTAYFRKQLGGYADSGVLRELAQRIEGLDYIVAPFADARMFEIIEQFIDGEITDEQCLHCLLAMNPGKQYVLLTDKALRQAEVLERCFLTGEEKEAYSFSRQVSWAMNRDREKEMRRQYRNKGMYIEEILQ